MVAPPVAGPGTSARVAATFVAADLTTSGTPDCCIGTGNYWVEVVPAFVTPADVGDHTLLWCASVADGTGSATETIPSPLPTIRPGDTPPANISAAELHGWLARAVGRPIMAENPGRERAREATPTATPAGTPVCDTAPRASLQWAIEAMRAYGYQGLMWVREDSECIGCAAHWGDVADAVAQNPCALQFADLLPDSTYRTYGMCLACNHVVSGYDCGAPGEPCDANHDPYFRPNNEVTRGQAMKLVVLSAAFPSQTPTGGDYTFEDVLPDTVFYPFVETAAARGIISGYNCGATGEPCDAQNRPYFRLYNNMTRAQFAKVDVLANAWDIVTPPGNDYTFADVPRTDNFFSLIETAAAHGVINGYDCGGPDEPCDSLNRPYFRPYANITRGQVSKLIERSFYSSGCGADAPVPGGAMGAQATPTPTVQLPTAVPTADQVDGTSVEDLPSPQPTGGP